MFWQVTVDAREPAKLARFWAEVLGYRSAPPVGDESWWRHYRHRLGDQDGFSDRLFPPDGQGPALWFQPVPESKAGKNRLHLDVYVTGRDNDLDQERRVSMIDERVAELEGLGATVLTRTRDDDPDAEEYFVTLADPEGNEFCVS